LDVTAENTTPINTLQERKITSQYKLGNTNQQTKKYAKHDFVIKFPISNNSHIFNTPNGGRTDLTNVIGLGVKLFKIQHLKIKAVSPHVIKHVARE
jgi:hypothetical protein